MFRQTFTFCTGIDNRPMNCDERTNVLVGPAVLEQNNRMSVNLVHKPSVAEVLGLILEELCHEHRYTIFPTSV